MVTTTFKLLEDDYNWLSSMAMEEDRSISGMMRQIFREYRKQHESPENENYKT
jgi:hypothetical protein